MGGRGGKAGGGGGGGGGTAEDAKTGPLSDPEKRAKQNEAMISEQYSRLEGYAERNIRTGNALDAAEAAALTKAQGMADRGEIRNTKAAKQKVVNADDAVKGGKRAWNSAVNDYTRSANNVHDSTGRATTMRQNIRIEPGALGKPPSVSQIRSGLRGDTQLQIKSLRALKQRDPKGVTGVNKHLRTYEAALKGPHF